MRPSYLGHRHPRMTTQLSALPRIWIRAGHFAGAPPAPGRRKNTFVSALQLIARSLLQAFVALAVVASAFGNPTLAAVVVGRLVDPILVEASEHARFSGALLGVFWRDRLGECRTCRQS